jgi:hypothetical protein
MSTNSVEEWLLELDKVRPADGQLTGAIKQSVGPLPIQRRDYSTLADDFQRVAARSADENRATNSASLQAQTRVEQATVDRDDSAAGFWRSVVAWANSM